MSRGPGKMMRAVLAELAECGATTAYTVVLRARHDAQPCRWCDEDGYQSGCTDGYPWPSRSELVSARRAMRALARSGEYELHRHDQNWPEGRPPPLCVAKPGHLARLATLKAEQRSKLMAAFREATP